MRSRRLIPAILLAAAVSTFAGSVLAQSAEVKAGARAAAESGYSAYEAGDFDKALDYFTRAEELIHAPPHLLFIARSNEKLGRLVAAREAYLKIVREELPAGSPPVFAEAQADAEKELEALEPRIPSLNIAVSGAGDAPVEVLVDGKPVPPALVGIPRPIDPGKHTIEAKSAGLKSEVITIDAAEGSKQEVELKLVPSGEAAPEEATSEVAVSEPTNGPSWTSPLAIGGYVSLGVGAAALPVGIVMLGQSSNTSMDADIIHQCNETEDRCSGEEIEEINRLDSKASSQKAVGIAGLAVGGAALATGATLLIINAMSEPGAESSKIQPWIGLGQVGFSGKF